MYMPMLWRRIAWFISFAVAISLALWMRTVGYGWAATIGSAFIVWVCLPFVISQLCAAFVLVRIHRRAPSAIKLAEEIAKAIKDLPPEERLAEGKRIIDQWLK
jgi:hypothetical protein